MHTLGQFSFKSRISCPPELQADLWIVQEYLQDNIAKINFWLGITTLKQRFTNPGNKTSPCIFVLALYISNYTFSELDFRWLRHPMALGDLVICSLVGAESFQGQRQNDWAEHPAANRVTWFPFSLDCSWWEGVWLPEGSRGQGLAPSQSRGVCFFSYRQLIPFIFNELP